jgi:hydroxymethylpyrimidine/phosphomethylpyrimidine kinase
MTASDSSPAPARTPIALTIAGSDSSGGAGIQADLKTFCAFSVYGASVLTALTAQNTRGVFAVESVPPAFVVAQMDAVLGDLDVDAIKTGMLANAAIVEAVAGRLASVSAPVVVDPVMVATSGDPLLEPDAVESIRRRLIPRATLITPNMPEAARLLNRPVAETEEEFRIQAHALLDLGCRAVLLKGGHATGNQAIDILCDSSGTERLVRPMLDTRNTHGTGCTLSAAIAALLARGAGLRDAVERAKTYVWHALQAGRSLGVGSGSGPVDHLFAVRQAPPPA